MEAPYPESKIMNGEGAYFLEQRQRMVAEDMLARDIYDQRVLHACRQVPRQEFVPPEYHPFAYADNPLPIGHGQTISQPYIVAFMTQLLALQGDERVLEIGTGSGYQAAILGLLAREVHTVEHHVPLANRSAQTLNRLGFQNVFIHVGDGSLGWPPAAPYQAIIVTAASPDIPPPLLDQLVDGGRLVLPIGGANNQILELCTRFGPHLQREQIIPVAFVPLLGQFGWDKGW